MRGYNQYGGNYNYQASTWRDWVTVVGVVVGMPGGLYLIYRLYKVYQSAVLEYGSQQVWGTVIATCVIVFVVGTISWAIAERVLHWYDSLWWGGGYNQKAAQTSYNNSTLPKSNPLPVLTPKTTFFNNKGTGLLAGERENPPRAEFFGKFNGEERSSTGAYEEKYLNTFEKTYWNKQKALDPSLVAVSKYENDPNKFEMVETTTKIDKWV